MKSFFAFIFSKTFLIQVLIAIFITVIGVMVSLYMLDDYTNHGETYTVPKLEGMAQDDAEKVLNEHRMVYVLSDSLYSEIATPGTIIDQQPKAGQQVKEGRKIFITICALAPEQIEMPRLTDISFRQAMNLLKLSGLHVGEISYEASQYPGLVLEQKFNGVSISPGVKISKGESIDFIIGKRGAGEFTVVPNLIGEEQLAASQQLSTMQLNVGAIIYDETVVTKEDSLMAKVWQQRPTPNSNKQIRTGMLVDMWLTVDSTKVKKEIQLMSLDSIINEENFDIIDSF